MSNVRSITRAIRYTAIIVFVLGIVASATMLSAANLPSTSVTIVNNSSREIKHVYLSATTDNNWGADQLDPSTISAGGGTFTLSNVSCSGAGVKVIAEDADGCFVYKVVSCDESTTWTITNEAARDCGE
jgi:hypothetical protein